MSSDAEVPAEEPPTPLVTAFAAALEASRDPTADEFPSYLGDFIATQREPFSSPELARKTRLHAQFMRELVRSWSVYSQFVRSLLLDAAPSRLIPPLVDLVAEFLDLEKSV